VFWFAEKEKVQTGIFNKEYYVHHIVGHSVLLAEFLPQVRTINSSFYCEMLKKLKRAIQNKRCRMQSVTILLLHDNARPHSAAQTQDLITSLSGNKWTIPRTALIWRQVISASSYT
jgi:hypothetical protein